MTEPLFRTPSNIFLPLDYTPKCPEHLTLEKIILSKGALAKKEREDYVRRICKLFPGTPIIERLDVPHNKIEMESSDPLERHKRGKHTLVFGVLGDCVRYSEEEGNACPNYWHFSTTGFCFYDCRYCYLAGTPGVWFSPTVKIYLNIEDVTSKIDATANRIGKPTAFYHGKLQDGLSLDPLTGFSTLLVPFFAGHTYARQILLTKSDEVQNLLDLEHGGRTILSWSLNPPEVADRFERNIPSVEERIAAMKKCAERGYPIRAVLMPMIPVSGWEDIYAGFIRRLLEEVPLQRLTIGGICSYKNSKGLMDQKLGRRNPITTTMNSAPSPDGRRRYPQILRGKMYSHILATIKSIRPDMETALCLEEKSTWNESNISPNLGRCNCVL